ncbi:MAG TPA: hypothetical protein VIV14_13305 [Gammaproteobacteria bacterium]
MNILLFPKEPWIMRRAAGIARQTGKPLDAARTEAEHEHRELQEHYGEIRKKTKPPVLRLDPDQLFE